MIQVLLNFSYFKLSHYPDRVKCRAHSDVHHPYGVSAPGISEIPEPNLRPEPQAFRVAIESRKLNEGRSPRDRVGASFSLTLTPERKCAR